MNEFVTKSGGVQKELEPLVKLAKEEVLSGHNISLMGLFDDERMAEDHQRGPWGVRWLSVAEGVVENPKVDLLFLGLTGDKGRSRELAALAESHQRIFRSSLDEPFNAWRGDWLAIYRRLLAVFQANERWQPEPDLGKTYAAIQKAIVLELCRPPLGPPRSSAGLKRLKDEALLACDGLSPFRRCHRLLDDAIHRMGSVRSTFDVAGTKLNGKWAWEDANVAYVGMVEEESVIRDILAPMLVFSLTEHLEALYRQGRSCVVFIDVHPEDIELLEMERLFGAAWAFGSGVVLLPQVTGHLSRFVRLYFPSFGALAEAYG